VTCCVAAALLLNKFEVSFFPAALYKVIRALLTPSLPWTAYPQKLTYVHSNDFVSRSVTHEAVRFEPSAFLFPIRLEPYALFFIDKA
jgi:hypothetical protein